MGFAVVGSSVPSVMEETVLSEIIGFFVLPAAFLLSITMWYFGALLVGGGAFLWKKWKPESNIVEKLEGRSAWSLLVTAPLIAIVLGFLCAIVSHKFLITWLVYAGLGLLQGVCLFVLAQLRLLSLDDLFADD